MACSSTTLITNMTKLSRLIIVRIIKRDILFIQAGGRRRCS